MSATVSRSVRMEEAKLQKLGYSDQQPNQVPATLGEIVLNKVDDTSCIRKILFHSTTRPIAPDLGFLVRKSDFEICLGL